MQEMLRCEEIAILYGDIALITDLEGNICKASQAACEAYGYPAEILTTKKITDLYVEEAANAGGWLEQARKDGVTFEARQVRQDGSLFAALITARRIVMAQRELLLFLVRDISERKAKSAELRKFVTAVEQSPTSIVITDLQGTIEYVNPKFTQVTGYTPQEAIGQNPRVLKSGEQPPEVYHELWKTITNGREWRGEFHNKKKDGDLYWELASISPIRDADGTITHYIAVKEDITERKATEAALRHAHAELQQIIETSGDGLCVVDANGIMLRVNSAFAAMCGLEAPALIGRKLCEVATRKFCEEDRCSLARVLAGEKRFEFDLQLALPDGQNRHWLTTVNAFHDASGELIGMVKTYKDITERVQAQEALKRDLQMAGKIQRSFLPKALSIDCARIDTIFEPHHHVSGDVFDFSWNERRKVLSGHIIDVMGHGMGTALQTAALRVLCRQVMERELSPRARLTWINYEAAPCFAEDSFAAAIYFEFDFKQNILKYSAAGINYFWANTNAKKGIVSIPGSYLGISSQAEYEEHSMPFAAGDSFYFMSDGLFELLEYQPDVCAGDYQQAYEGLLALTLHPQRHDDASALCIHIK